ncbi:MinD/ParA family protein [Bacillus spongiae]|uniref:MinD/ParA family protein n=1 Tax=Bacillus spongiae TaxID=2683610 RepID=A0ABU8HAL6_9BACI
MNDQAQGLRTKLQRQSIARTIGVVSGKSGLGTSNFSVNMCTILAKANKKVLLLNLDFGMANVHLPSGENPERTIMDFLNENIEVHEIVHKGSDGVSYISGGTGLSSCVNWPKEKFDRFADGLQFLQQYYEYIFFDMGALASKDRLDLMMTLDETILITTPEPTDIMDAYSLIKHISLLGGEQELYIVCNRAQSEKQGEETLSRLQGVVRKFLQKKVSILGIIMDDTNVGEAVANQVPYSIQYPNHPAARGLAAIAMSYLATPPLNCESSSLKFTFIDKLRKLFIVKGEVG